MGPLHSILTAVPQAALLTPRTSDIGVGELSAVGQSLASTQMSPGGGGVQALTFSVPFPLSGLPAATTN